MSEKPTAPTVWLSVVIPAFNEEGRLASTLSRVSSYLASRRRDFEILVVDDGSSDETLSVAESLAAVGVKPLRLAENRGKGAALRLGVLQSHGRYVLLCDADLSTPIEEIEKLEARMRDCDLVLGSRALASSDIRRRQPRHREWMGRVFNLMLRLGGIVTLRDTQCGFKLIEGSVARGLFDLLTTRGFAYDVELVWLADRLKLAVAEVGVVWRDSPQASKVRAWRDPVRMMLEVAGFLARHSFGVRPYFHPRYRALTAPVDAVIPPGRQPNRLPRQWLRRQWALALLLSCVVALGFQGSRAIFEPDEGFYTNVALGMEQSGDWTVPRLNGEPFLDKPPLLYWGVGWGVRLLGTNEWGARTAQALWFVATSILVGLFAGRLWGAKRGPLAAIVYSTMLAPAIAADVLTPDTILAFWSTFLVYMYWRYFTSDTRRAGWMFALLMGLGVGGGALAKGPAILLFLPPIALHLASKKGWRAVFRPELIAAAVMAAVIGGSWYLAVADKLPGAWAYWLDNQIAGRLWSDNYHRNPQWWAGLEVYGAVLLVGGLPWTPLWFWKWLRRLRAPARLAGGSQAAKAEHLLIRFWFLLPLAVLFVARSRLPLYGLPLMAPLALATTALLLRGAFVTLDRRRVAALALFWVALLITLRGVVSVLPFDESSREVAAALGRAGIAPPTRIVAVDTKESGLRFYGYGEIIEARVRGSSYPFFVSVPSLSSLAEEDDLPRQGFAVVEDIGRRDTVLGILEKAGFSCLDRPAIYELEFLECTAPETSVG